MLVENRVREVWIDILKLQKRELHWFDFNNEGGRDGPEGYFDPDYYEKEITFNGEWSGRHDDLPYNDYIPVEFLWEDYEEKVLGEMKTYKEDKEKEKAKNIAKRIEFKERRKRMIESIKSKLTKEELSFTRFKDLNEIYEKIR